MVTFCQMRVMRTSPSFSVQSTDRGQRYKADGFVVDNWEEFRCQLKTAVLYHRYTSLHCCLLLLLLLYSEVRDIRHGFVVQMLDNWSTRQVCWVHGSSQRYPTPPDIHVTSGHTCRPIICEKMWDTLRSEFGTYTEAGRCIERLVLRLSDYIPSFQNCFRWIFETLYIAAKRYTVVYSDSMNSL